jgi:hypothetical protein
LQSEPGADARQQQRHLGKLGTGRTDAFGKMGRVVARWRKQAAKLGLAPAEIDRMVSAFEHEDLQAVLALCSPREGCYGGVGGCGDAPRGLCRGPREMAQKKGLPYQTYMKMLLHQALEMERRAS